MQTPIDITPGTGPAPAPYPRERLRVPALALAAVLAGGVGYVVVQRPAASLVAAPAPAVPVPSNDLDSVLQAKPRPRATRVAAAPGPAPGGGALSASVSGRRQPGADRGGWSGLARIENRTARPDRRWQLVLTVPGDGPVYADPGVRVTRSGDRAVLTATGPAGAVPAGGRLSFWIYVDGRRSGGPTGCLIDSRPCG